jgi:hypothetical protein
MRPQLTCSLLASIAIFSLVSARDALAVSEVTQLTPANIATQDAFAFSVNAKGKGDLVEFVFKVTPKGGGALSSILEGDLMVKDGDVTIAICPIDKTRTDKGVTYTFVVAGKYLGKSEFNFANMAVSNGQPMPAGDFYWFYLGDFAPAK